MCVRCCTWGVNAAGTATMPRLWHSDTKSKLPSVPGHTGERAKRHPTPAARFSCRAQNHRNRKNEGRHGWVRVAQTVNTFPYLIKRHHSASANTAPTADALHELRDHTLKVHRVQRHLQSAATWANNGAVGFFPLDSAPHPASTRTHVHQFNAALNGHVGVLSTQNGNPTALPHAFQRGFQGT